MSDIVEVSPLAKVIEITQRISMGEPSSLFVDWLAERDHQAARIVESLCDWAANYGDARTVALDHNAYHWGAPCPYHAMAEVLRGRPDPRHPIASGEADA